MLNANTLANAIKSAVEGKKIDITRSVPQVSGDGKTTDLTGSVTDHVLPPGDAGWQAIVDAISAEVVKHIQQYLEIKGGQMTLTGGNLTGVLNGTGGGPVPVVVTNGTVASETGTVNIPAGAAQ